jgi:hypothetical protein
MARFLAIALFLALAACAQRPIAFDKKAASDVHSIAVLSCNDPPDYQFVSPPGPALYFGLVGGLVQTAMWQADGKKLTDAMKEQHPRLCSALTSAIAAGLRREGYQVSELDVARSKATDTMDSYASIKTDADAILDVVVNDMMLAADKDGLCAPNLVVKAKLIKLPAHQTIYSDFLIYGPAKGKLVILRGPGNATKVAEFDAPQVTSTFQDFDTALAHPDQVAATLRAGIGPLAGYITQQLKQ